jgi:predicted transcriptional regulator
MYGENEVIKLLQKMGNEFNSIEVDAEKFVEGNNSAGTRLRKAMQNIKNIAQQVRVEVQNQKNSVTI